MEEQDYRTTYELEDHNWWFVGMRRVVRGWLERSVGSSGAALRVVDVGCGTGRNLEDLRSLGTAVGIDRSATALAFCRTRGLDGLVQATGEALPLPDGSVDVVTAIGVIEHIEADADALADWARVLVPGGHLVLLTSAYRWLWSGHDVSNHHVRRYTVPELRAALERAGFEAVELSYLNTVLLAPIALVRLGGRLRRQGRPPAPHKDTAEVPEVANRALAALLGAEARWSLRRPLPFGVSIIASARAPQAGAALRSGTSSG